MASWFTLVFWSDEEAVVEVAVKKVARTSPATSSFANEEVAVAPMSTESVVVERRTSPPADPS